MYKAIIAEDEFLVRVGIKTAVDWPGLRIELAGEASNGKEAYDLYLEKSPQIIITDIKMPVMDGMELIKRVREERGDRDTRFVILSCVDEFALVQKALNYNVSHYFLKITMSGSEIQTVLESIVQELDRKTGGGPADREATQRQIMADCLRLCCKNQSFDHGAVQSTLRKLGLRLEDSIYTCMLMKALPKQSGFDRTSALNIIEGTASRHASKAFELEENLYCIVAPRSVDSGGPEPPDPGAVARSVMLAVLKFLNLSMLAGIGGLHSGLKELPIALGEAGCALHGCYFSGMDLYERASANNRFKANPVCFDELKKVFNANTRLPNPLIAEYMKKLDGCVKKEYATPEEFKDELCMMLFWLAAQADIADESFEQLMVASEKKILASATLAETTAELKSFISCVSATSFEKKAPEIIRSVLGYINENFASNISLRQVANVVHLNPSYLSSLFKKKMRCSFVEYVNAKRVKKAQALLWDTDDPIHRIALKVGFAQEEYFYKIFKRIAGLTPSEYRSRRADATGNEIAGARLG